MKYYFKVLKNYAVLNGRARRKEYWMFFLFNSIIVIILESIGLVLLVTTGFNYGGLFASGYQFAILVPSVAVGFRRMHDVNKSGWYILIPVYNLILACTDGSNGDNKYGKNPKEIDKK